MRKWCSSALSLVVVVWMLHSCSFHQTIADLSATAPLLDGDLLFHVVERTNAITAVTTTAGQLEIDHVGVVFHRDGDTLVVEAYNDGVVVIPLDTFLHRPGRYLHERVRSRRFHAAQSVENCLSHVGEPYDSLYLPHNGAMYCSELVLESFTDSKGERLFQPVGMTFRDTTGQIPAYWTALYARHGMAVPEGRPGSNPSELSRRKELKVVGWR